MPLNQRWYLREFFKLSFNSIVSVRYQNEGTWLTALLAISIRRGGMWFSEKYIELLHCEGGKFTFHELQVRVHRFLVGLL